MKTLHIPQTHADLADCVARAVLLASVVVALAPSVADAAAIVPGFNSSSLAANDDGSTGAVPIGLSNPLNFFGTNYSTVFVNNNGNVTFTAPLSTFTPFGLSSTSIPMIAPFFADVDTRGVGSGIVTYGNGAAYGHGAFGANWINVGYYPGQTNRLNSFQLVLVDRSDTGAGNFDIHFNYDKIQWETGGASGGSNGLGGTSASAGYSNGATTFDQLLGSLVNGAFLDFGPNSLAAGSNIGSPGSFEYDVRNGIVRPPVVVPVPEPGSALAGMLALGVCLSGLGRRNRQAK